MREPFGRIGWRRGRGRGAVPRREALPERPPLLNPRLINRLVFLVVALYALTFASLSVLQHDSFQTHAFDLGNMDQAVWNTAQGRPFEFSNWEGGTTRLAAHVEPILLLIAPLYLLYSDPRLLLVLQTVVISLGALPAFWLARAVLRNDFAALSFAAAYLLSPALETANLSDFHPVSLSSALLLFAFYFAYQRRYLLFAPMALLAMATKEQVPLAVALVGGYILLVQGERRWGWATLVVALAWAGAAFFLIIPHFNPSGASPYLSRYDHLGGSPRGILLTLITDPARVLGSALEPAKLDYLRRLLEPVGYLSLLSPLTFLFALPDLAISLLSNFPDMYLGRAHYGAVLVPFIIISAIFGAHLPVRLLSRRSPRAGRALVYLLSALVLVLSLRAYYRDVFLPLVDHLPVVDAHHRIAAEFMALIPAEASLSTSSALNPHLSQRRRLHLFPTIGDADYIFLDVSSTPYPIDVAETHWRVKGLLEGGEWGILAARDGYLLLKRGAEPRSLPDEFFSFARAAEEEIPHRVAVDFGDTLRLVGYRLQPEGPLHGNDPYARLTLYWQASAVMGEDFLFPVFVLAGDGTEIDSLVYHPASTWYPTSRWQPGELIQVVVERVPLGGYRWGRVLVGVVRGRDPKLASARLRPQLRGDSAPLPLSDDGTLVILTKLRVE